MYSIRVFNPKKPFDPDQYCEDPQAAVDLAISLSAEHPVGICSDARNWGMFQEGHLVSRSVWEDFYEGETSPEYEALTTVLDRYPVVRTAKVLCVTDQGAVKKVVYRCVPPLYDEYEFVLASASVLPGRPETLLFGSNVDGARGQEIVLAGRPVFDTEAALREQGYTCSA